MVLEEFIKNIKFDDRGLVPCIAQDARTGEVLMLAYANEEALRLAVETGYATYYSRSRQKIWKKGENSGHLQKLQDIRLDCDGDTVLYLVEQAGPACHTGERNCFYRRLGSRGLEKAEEEFFLAARVLEEEYGIIIDRMKNPREGSYTNYLLEKGIDKICKKIGEESAEVIIGAKNRNKDEVIYEIADLMYHLMVLMAEQEVSWRDIFHEMLKRRR